MSSLLDRATGPARPPAGARVAPSPYATAAFAAVRAVAAGMVPVMVPVVLAWVMGAGGQATWVQTVRLAFALWLLAHHTGLALSSGHVGLAPLGLAVVPLLACWYSGRRLARAVDPRAERIAARTTRAAPALLSPRLLVAFAGVYCLLACLVSFVAGMSGLRPVSGQALVASACVALGSGGMGALDYRRTGWRGAVRVLIVRLPDVVRLWLRPALAALAALSAAGAMLVAVLLVTHVPGILDLYRALDPGGVGEAVLTLAQVLLLPNLVVWAVAVLAGPGFAIGAGTSVTVTSSTLGPLPAVPLLAALPAPGALPPAATALLAVPVLAGVLAGVIVVRGGDSALTARLTRAGGAAGLCAVVSALAGWLSGGPAGPGRMTHVGPEPLLFGLALGGEVLLGAGLTILVAAVMPRVTAWFRTPSAPDRPAAS